MADNVTLLAFDFGLKRIGVAVGQTLTQTATALDILSAKDGVPDWQIIQQLINVWRADALLVGIPLNMDGTEQAITVAAKQFAKQLEQFNKPVYTTDERLSTKEIRAQVFEQGGYKALKKAAIDSLVAKLLVENWMRQRGVH